MKMPSLKRIWNFEITSAGAAKVTWLPIAIILLVPAYIVAELLLLSPNPDFLTWSEFKAYFGHRFTTEGSLAASGDMFPFIWAGLLLLTFCTRMYVSIYGYFVRSKVTDTGMFYRNLLVYTSTGMMSILIGILMLLAGGIIYQALGFSFSDGFAFLEKTEQHLADSIKHTIPTLFVVKWKWLAILLALSVYSLTGYFLHWLTHVSRFLWHVVHAPHHLPDFLHPLGTPLGYTFDFFLLLPKVVLSAVLTKLFYSEPLVLEMAILALLGYNLEIFNHATVHYELVRKNRVLNFLSQFFGGNGAYHYFHHSSAKENQMANLGGGVFLMWDRLFGTFTEPPVQPPAIGWTNNPDTYMNPFRVLFGGPARILYELKMNKDWKSRFLILFGPINYEPEVTINYIKKH
jgi:sterol desaturase/sphingolipid hydroxylase (fatty acid hydroxylase superfamily)